MWFDLPAFVSKNSVRNYPFVGIIAEGFQCIFLERAGSREEKERAIKQIIERQKLSKLGLLPKLCIYPEGATTNNEYLL